ncbi:MAG: AI-2E family transporter [Flavobacteriia bacterium]|nr:AI-2E family transporter [Flavobacteriia bacterium]
MNPSKYTSIILLLISVFFILYIGKPIILPFIFAVFIYYIIRSIRRFFDRNYWIKKVIPGWVKHLFAAIFIFTTIFIILKSIVINAQNLPLFIQKYELNIALFSKEIKNLLGFDIKEKLISAFNSIDFTSFANYIINSFSTILGHLMLIVFYVMFLFFEEQKFTTKITLIFSNKKNHLNTVSIHKNIEHSMIQYISIKTLISLISATVCFGIMFSMNLKLPFLWSLGIFLFSYIPVIGTFFAVILPFLFSIIQFGNISSPFLLLILLSVTLLFVTNFVEPKIAGSSLNISPLVALISLSVWGTLWGIAGMILSVPITVTIIILFANFNNTRPIAILLSNTGHVGHTPKE